MLETHSEPNAAGISEPEQTASARDGATGDGRTEEARTAPGEPIQAEAEAPDPAQPWIERLARVQADFENFRRRSQQERQELLRYANQELIARLIPLLDNLERAIASGRRYEAPDSWLEGVELVRRQFVSLLEREGVRRVEAVGRPFDPTRHQAVARQPTGDQPEDTVLEEFQAGYMMADRLLRPALVKVATRAADEPSESASAQVGEGSS